MRDPLSLASLNSVFLGVVLLIIGIIAGSSCAGTASTSTEARPPGQGEEQGGETRNPLQGEAIQTPGENPVWGVASGESSADESQDMQVVSNMRFQRIHGGEPDGLLVINPSGDGGIDFELTVWAAKGHHGEVKGSALRYRAGFFTYKGERDCVITFELDSSSVIVKINDWSSCNTYHGARCYLDGTFVKVEESQ